MKLILSYIIQYFKKMDKQLLFAVIILSAFSVLILYSIVTNNVATGDRVSSRTYKMQLVTAAMGIVGAMVISALDYNKYIKLWFLFGPGALILCLLLFTPLGMRAAGGADDIGWIRIGPAQFQPSEMLKLAFILTFALHLSKVEENINKLGNVLLLCLHGGVPVLLIALTGDDGTAIVFAAIFLFMIFAAGLSWKYILPVCVAMPPLAYLAWRFYLSADQKLRFLVLFFDGADPDIEAKMANSKIDFTGITVSDLVTKGYQQRQGQIALGSGQLFGKGLFGGEYTGVPEVHNDMIFSYVGQTLGFVGCIALVAVLCYVCLKIVADSRIAKDSLGKYICIGVFAMIFTHCVINIGVVLGVMPVIGVPLPFTSAGGTAMLSMYVCIGMVMSVYSHSEKNYRVFYDPN